MENIKTEYLIIGAGISGLSFANFIGSEDYIITEKNDEIGGYCRTIYKNGYIWDYSGHFYHFKNDRMKKMFNDLMKDEEIVTQQKNTKIYYKGNLIDYPFQSNIHQLEKSEFIDCLYDLFNKEEKENYDSFLDMLYGKFGKSIVEKFLKPYNEKLYACDLNTLDKDAMGRFFPYADLKQIIDNMKREKDISYNNQFLYPRKGAISFINKLYDKLDKTKIKLNTEIVAIDSKNKIATTSKGDKIYYKYLINSSPLNNFLELLNTEESNELLGKLTYNKVLVFNLGFEKKSKFDEHWIYFPDKEINFYRVGFYDNILNADKLSMYIEIGYGKDEKNINIDEQLKLTIKNLQKVGIVEENNKLVDYEALLLDPAYVHVHNNTNKDVESFFKKIKEDNIYSLGRYGAWVYCSMEDCMLEAEKLAQEI